MLATRAAFQPVTGTVAPDQPRVGVASWNAFCPALEEGSEGLQDHYSECSVPKSVFRPERLEAASGLSRRELKKLDRFSVLAIAAARSVLEQAVLCREEREQCGVFTGNMVGGWTFTETQLRNLHRAGLSEVSPYLATAWFPAAPQGQITIHFGLKGFSKTISTDRCAGAQAIGLGFELIREGKCNLLLAGGVEAPCTPFVEAAPASFWAGAAELAEGAAYLLLTTNGETDIALAGHSTFASRYPRPGFSTLLRSRISDMGLQDPPTFLVCNIPCTPGLRREVLACIKEVFGCEPETVFPTEKLGDSLAASGAVSAAIACSRLQEMSPGSSAMLISCGHQCCDLLCFERT